MRRASECVSDAPEVSPARLPPGGTRLHPSLLVADGKSESKRLRQGGEEESLSYLETVTTAERKERKGTA